MINTPAFKGNIDITELLALLQTLVKQPSFSRQEEKTANTINDFLRLHGATTYRSGHNVWAKTTFWNPEQPTLLLNSHHDTVKPAAGWQRDPFGASLEGDMLFGLGSNDAGASLVCLIGAFLSLSQQQQPYNLVLAATAEEEISGSNGIAAVLPELGCIDLAIVGEPTQCQLAVAEKGLMVLDCTARGQAGHAARNEGINSIYLAIEAVEWFRDFRFPQVSELLGEVKMSVTQIEAGTQHNVVPDRCKFVVDVRTTEHYSNAEALEIIRAHTRVDVQPRSLRLNSSGISLQHPVVQRGRQLGLTTFGSPTLSDQALMPFTSLKIGPGDSARSHTAEEYITVPELQQGLQTYVQLLQQLKIPFCKA